MQEYWLGSQSWSSVTGAPCSSSKVAALHQVIEEGMRSCFEKKVSCKKTSEPSWISTDIRTLIRRRRAVFKREGRSRNWWRLKKKSAVAIKNRRDRYNKEKKEKIMGADRNNFFKCVNSFLNEAEAWDIRSMYPGMTDKEIADTVAVFFNKISSEYPPLEMSSIPVTFDDPLPVLDRNGTEKLLRDAKKPKSVVQGDMFPESVRRNYRLLVTPVLDIINCVQATAVWPALWKIEFQTCIPKKPSPISEDE